MSFLPAVSDDAKKAIGREIRSWRINRRSDKTLEDLARMINPIVQGWINYYGRFYKSGLYPLLRRINEYLVRWAMRKYKRLRRRTMPGRAWLAERRATRPRPLRPLAARRATRRLDDGSRMSGEVHVRFCESRGVRFPPATHLRPCSHGFRPGRRAQDAIAEIRHLTSVRYEWVLEGDITACFDEIDHTALMDRVRHRIGDKRVLGLVKAFLKAGVLSEDGIVRDTDTGTPQGGILSPLLANIALSVLDDHFVEAWRNEMATAYQRKKRRNHGRPNYRLVRYADDFVVVIHGDRADAEALREEVAAVLAPAGLRLSETKTTIAHIDEGFDFLGWRIQRHRKRGTAKHFVYTYPSKTSLAKVMATVKTLCRQGRNEPLSELLRRLNPVLRGWTNYFRHGVSKATFGYLRAYTWARVVNWLRRKHPRANWKWLRRRYLPRWWPTEGDTTMFDPGAVAITYARYRGQVHRRDAMGDRNDRVAR